MGWTLVLKKKIAYIYKEACDWTHRMSSCVVKQNKNVVHLGVSFVQSKYQMYSV